MATFGVNSFIIYPAGYTGLNGQTGLISLTSLYDFQFVNQQNVAYEPIEQGSFSVDSKQDTPSIIKITATKIPIIYSTTDLDTITVRIVTDTINLLERYNKSATLLSLYNKFKLYDNYTLYSFQYSLNPTKTAFFAELEFKQIRLAVTQYQKLPSNKVKNKQNASTIDTGNQQAQPPTASYLKGLAG